VRADAKGERGFSVRSGGCVRQGWVPYCARRRVQGGVNVKSKGKAGGPMTHRRTNSRGGGANVGWDE